MTLNNVEKDRYSRNILLNEIGEKGQLKLINSSVLIIGAGALGSIVAMYLFVCLYKEKKQKQK